MCPQRGHLQIGKMAFSSHEGTESEQAAAQALGNHFWNMACAWRIIVTKILFVERSLGISFEQVERATCTRPRLAIVDSKATGVQGACVVVAAALVGSYGA